MGVSKNSGTPKSSILIGVSIIFTIHFAVPLFLETSMVRSRLFEVQVSPLLALESQQVPPANPAMQKNMVCQNWASQSPQQPLAFKEKYT